MSELLVALVAALPALAALGVIGTRSTPLLGRVWRGTPRPAKLAAFALAIAACHPSCNDYARGPVPQATLPFAEPVTYASGPNAGRPVESRNGLLASYFAGTNYDRLDHQRIDPNVDFTWDATGQNPVIPDATVANHGLDENHGFSQVGPPIWGIWSVVWEGYLEAPADGPYVLGVHANNGGWLEMKRAAGGLETVVANPGGPSFEGTVTATRTLAAGRHYLRLSYYQSGAPSGVARLLWQPPGAAELSVIPTSALFTQQEEPVSRGFIFVHGIKGSYRDEDSFRVILRPLELGYEPDRPFPSVVERFRYYQDRGDHPEGGVCRSRPARVPREAWGLPLNTASIDSTICDSQSNVGLNAVLLDEDVRELQARLSGGKVTILANSMGAAIVRAFLAYSVDAGTGGAAAVDNVYFLQGAQQGSWAAYGKPVLLGLMAPAGPIRQIIFHGVSQEVRERTEFDAERPAIDDLLPFFSPTYRYVNPRPEHIPDHIGYFNVASDIRWRTDVNLVGYTFGVRQEFRVGSATPSLGDYVMLEGSDRPTALPLLGGGRFLPSAIGRGRESGQWILEREIRQRMDVTITYIPLAPIIDASFEFPGDPFAVPESHFEFGAKMGEITVADLVTGERISLDRAILRQIARQGR